MFGFRKAFLDFIFYETCFFCGKSGTTVCRRCLNSLEPARLKCLKCGQHNPYGLYCEGCKSSIRPEQVLALYRYNGIAKDLIHIFKYEDGQSLTSVFGKKLGSAIKKHRLSGFVLVPIPLSKKRLRYRGYNQSLFLAKEITRHTSVPYADIMERKQSVLSQVQTGSKRERRQNVTGVFSIKKDVDLPSKIVLVDDVITTGATVEEATRILKQAGACEVRVLSIAIG